MRLDHLFDSPTILRLSRFIDRTEGDVKLALS